MCTRLLAPFSFLCLLSLCTSCSPATPDVGSLFSLGPAVHEPSPPIPAYGPTPTARQLAWQRMERLLFVVYGMNTYTDQEWGDGTERPEQFDPTGLDADQWVRVAKETGFKGIVFTAKHHEGFALWPSRYTDFSVANSPWRGGQGDVVREVADACRRHGIGFGVYLSPWDRHDPRYGPPTYDDYYVDQLTELLTQYGPVFEVWMDGAHGEGVDPHYDFRRYWDTIRRHQPEAVIAISGPDVRWIGNERGEASETEWSAREGRWYPGECDVPNRPGWFWHAREDEKVKSLQEHLEIYFTSVGRNCVLLLGVPPNRAGVFAAPDVRRLREFHGTLTEIFQRNLAAGKRARASNVRDDDPAWGPAQMLHADSQAFWTTDDGVHEAWVEIDLGERTTFNVIELAEPIVYGQRVQRYRIDVQRAGRWQTIQRGTTIGYKKLDRPGTVMASRIRLVIEEALAPPALSALGLYHHRLVPDAPR